MKTKREQILKYLQSGKRLDNIKAYNLYNTFSLAQHIKALRLQGANIATEMKIDNNTHTAYAEYYMLKTVDEVLNDKKAQKKIIKGLLTGKGEGKRSVKK